MSDVVVDSCVAAKLVLNEADSARAEQLVIEVSSRGDQIVVLDLCFAERGNVIWKHFRAKRIDFDEALLALRVLTESKFTIYRSESLLARSLELAMHYDKPLYDMLFVALVDQLDADGVTADVPLVAKVAGDFPKIKLLKDWQFS